ncbi:TonB-dependent receptor domain-containing protein [Roseibium aggregatum]|uniref:TonB-dependent receptor n=1 Tax=Roseibium aggregatum TaxID=187304 RepID=A0A939EDK5_9HYPH|nr:TonB-dependent receptor [Roseibium aggregatum]MBN9671326.1 TonB-dependent receptor [Roseibium aggregatum]
MKQKAVVLASASGLSLMAATAQAQVVQQLNTVVVQDTEADKFQTLESSIDISREEIEERQPADLKQLFQANPAVTTAGGSPASQKFYVHGIDQSKLNVTVDGARQKNNLWHHNGDLGINPLFLKAVEINDGVAPSDDGPGALGGTANFETADARDLLRNGQQMGALVSLGYDTNSMTLTGTGAGYGTVEGFEYLGALTRAEGQDYDDGDGSTELGTATDLWNGLAKLAYQSQEGHRFEVSGEYYRDNGYRRLRANMGFVSDDFNDNLYQRTTLTFKYTLEGAEGNFDPEVLLYYNRNQLDRPSQPHYTRASGDFNSDLQSFGGHVQNRFHFDMGTVTAGVDFYRDHVDIERFWFATDADETIFNVGGYMQARLTPLERLDVSTGLRADFQSYRAVDDQTFNNFGLSPNINVGYEVFEGLTANAGYAYVFGGIEQSEAALYHARDYVYSDDLDPTTAHNAKIGLTYQNHGLTLGADLFYIHMFNTIDFDYGISSRVNGDELISKGVDLSARYDWDMAYVSVAYTHTDVEYGDRSALYGDINSAVPVGDMLSLGAGYTFQNWDLTLGANAEIAFDYSDQDLEDNGFENPLPGYEVVNIFAEWAPKFGMTDFTLRGEVNNLFDETYYSRSSYPMTSRVTPVNSPGRSFYLTATAKF